VSTVDWQISGGIRLFEMTRKVYAQYRVEKLLDVIKGTVVHTLLCNSGNVEDLKRLEFKRKSGLDMVGGTPWFARDAPPSYVGTLLLAYEPYLSIPLSEILVGGTGIEPATSGL
jgi:hypothetical protein